MAEEQEPGIFLQFGGSYAADFIEGMGSLGLTDPADYMQILIQLGKVGCKALANGDPVFAPDREAGVTHTFRFSDDIMPPKLIDRFFATKMNESYAEDSMEGLRVVLPDLPPPKGLGEPSV